MNWAHRYLITISILSCFILTNAQPNWCLTKQSEKQKTWLKQFQQTQIGEQIPNTSKYLPVMAHLVGDNEGQGYYRLENLWSQMCDLNAHFLSTGLQFYLKDPIDFFNHSGLYNHTSQSLIDQGISSSLTSNMINLYFVHSMGDLQACGYYTGYHDCMVIDNGCAGQGDKTIMHEFGHFFSLNHTFYGWESGITPPIADQELVDGSNCATTADGFCDTPPDYISTPWNCPLNATYLDPNGDTLQPDETLHMSYASHDCRARFSQEQQTAMYNNWYQTRQNITSDNSVSTDSLGVTTLEFPYDGFKVPYNHVTFRWRSVPGADYYHLAMTHLPSFAITNNSYISHDTSFTVISWPNNPAFTQGRVYKWKVKAVSKGYYCDEYSQTSEFYVDPYQHNFIDDREHKKWELYPNPSQDMTTIYFRYDIVGEKYLKLYDLLGNKLRSEYTSSSSYDINRVGLSSGTYILEISINDKAERIKIVFN